MTTPEPPETAKMELRSDRIIIPDLDADTLVQALNGLTKEDTFVALEDTTDPSGLTSLQAGIAYNYGEFYALEYYEELCHYCATEEYFVAHDVIETFFSKQGVVETFLLYFKRNELWKTRYKWEVDNTLQCNLSDVNPTKLKEYMRYIENKYGSLKIEELALNDAISDPMKKVILTKLHNYKEIEATELLKTAQKEAKKARVREAKSKIIRKAQDLYPTNNINTGRQPISDEVKIFVWQRDGGKCAKCGGRENLEFDHIIPVSKGGSSTERNIQLLCEKCNREKSSNII